MDKLGVECVVQYKGKERGEIIKEPPARGAKQVDPSSSSGNISLQCGR
jgi:hypothetical protein